MSATTTHTCDICGTAVGSDQTTGRPAKLPDGWFFAYSTVTVKMGGEVVATNPSFEKGCAHLNEVCSLKCLKVATLKQLDDHFEALAKFVRGTATPKNAVVQLELLGTMTKGDQG